MTKIRRILALLLTAVMIVLSVAPLASCGDNTDGKCTVHADTNKDGVCDNAGCGAPMPVACTSHVDNNGDGICDTAGCGEKVTPAEKVNYTVQVKTIGGYFPEGLQLELYDTATGYTVKNTLTDDKGIATFKSVPQKSTYVVKFSEIYESKNIKVNLFLKGYEYEDEYAVSPAGTVITLVSKLQEPGHSGVTYQLSDTMHDFTVTDSDGKKQTLSEILKTKKAVILNFWFVNCSACVEEFPSIQAAYDTVYDEKTGAKYSDVVEVLALDNQGDTNKDIQAFKQTYGLTFPMAIDTEGVGRAFGFSQFPSTVIIDRYGMVTVTHVGAVVGSSYWKKLFSLYSSDNYVQRTAETFAELIPQDIPDVDQPSSDVIADSFVSPDDADIKVNFHPETKPGDADYSWPFITTEYVDKSGNKIKCVVPSNSGKDNSYAIMYATMQLEAGDAVMFDFHSSTESTSSTADILYIIVDGKDTYMISGLEKEDVWVSCCAFVAEEAGTYEVAFTYIKDAADDELPDVDDVVYLRNLRTVDKSEVDVETYIAREADKLTNDDIVLGADGYWHVGRADGPILLANFLGYTKFDRESTISTRMYQAGELIVGGKDMFAYLELHANYAANSDYYGFTSVNNELRALLEAYAKEYADDIGVAYTENTWLSLCEYFNAYGTGGKELEDPIKGVATFSAPDVIVTEDEKFPKYNELSYDRVIMPRGYLFKFVPTKSGVYRFITQSESEVNGWIFTGDHNSWAENGGNRTLYEDSEQGERFAEVLFRDQNNDGIPERDLTNASIIAYFEEGVEYYVAFGFYDVYEFSSFTFTATFVADEAEILFEASPGVFTYIEGTNQLIAGGIDVALAADGYYYHRILADTTVTGPVIMTSDDKYYSSNNGVYYDYETDDGVWQTKKHTVTVSNGTKTVVTEEYERGSYLYADFIWTTNIFTTRTFKQLIEAHAFDFAFTAEDLEGLAIYTITAKTTFEKMWMLEAWLEEAYSEELHGSYENYVYSMMSDRDIYEILFEEKWLNEDRETALRQQNMSDVEIELAKYEEWYEFYISLESKDINGNKDGYEAVYNYLKKNGKITMTLDAFKAEKAAWEKYYDEMTMTEDEIRDLFNEKWIIDGTAAALKQEGKTDAEIAKIKVERCNAFVEEKLAPQKAYKDYFNAKWESEGLADVEAGLYTATYYEGAQVDLYHKYGKRGFEDYYGLDGLVMWGEYTFTTESDDGMGGVISSTTTMGFKMEEILSGKFHGDIYSAMDKEAVDLFITHATRVLNVEWGANFGINWLNYGMEDIKDAFGAGELDSAELNSTYVQMFINAGIAGLQTLWGEDFDAKWAEYQLDDIIDGKFHNNYTEIMREIYNENVNFDDIHYDEEGNLVVPENPEIQGCVKVDKTLAQILQKLMDKYSFANVENSWTKLCYYYAYLGK